MQRINEEAGSTSTMGDPLKRRSDAAVLVPIYRRHDADLGIVLVRRSPGGPHGGEIAFPGGRRAPGDRSLRETALREASEETGLVADHVTFLADLPPVNTQTTAYRIYPFLARIRVPRTWRPQEDEIAEILEVRLLDLEESGAGREMVKKAASWKTAQNVPYYRVGRDRVWGATYRILDPLIPRLLAGEWDV